jgi:hypothetical protein
LVIEQISVADNLPAREGDDSFWRWQTAGYCRKSLAPVILT